MSVFRRNVDICLCFPPSFPQCCITSNESFPCLHYQFPLVHFTPARLIRVLPQINICVFKNKGLHPAAPRCARLPYRLTINLVIRVFTRESTGICLYDVVQEITEFLMQCKLISCIGSLCRVASNYATLLLFWLLRVSDSVFRET